MPPLRQARLSACLMDAATIAAELEGRKEGGQYRCRCPVHGGRSLMVKDGVDRPLVHCFGGCDPREILSELRSLNLYPPPSESQKAARKALRRSEDIEHARLVVVIAHEAAGVKDRFGKDYRWARKVLREAGYEVRFVPPDQREWPDQRVEVVAKNTPQEGGM